MGALSLENLANEIELDTLIDPTLEHTDYEDPITADYIQRRRNLNGCLSRCFFS